ncbi:MAG: hypothetical protein KGJ32_12650 [Xanthomonadaceae bacterium]|nr:hypothetical protein [Xanthomonadaceae bacterium]
MTRKKPIDQTFPNAARPTYPRRASPCDDVGATPQASFNIDVTTCVHCGGAARIVASIEEPAAIRAILDHFKKHVALEEAHYRPALRAPPAGRLRDR